MYLPVQAQEEEALDDEFALLEEALAPDEVVSASKHRQPIFWSPSAITVFTREDIQASGARDLPDLLRRVPGVDVYRLKPGFPLVGVRSLTSISNNLVLLLIDGREAMMEITGVACWNAVVTDLEQVERVEVIRGPGSALYGANAYSAVVSVTTTVNRSGGGQVSVSAGEAGDQRLLAKYENSFKLAGKKLFFGLSVSTKQESAASDPQTLLIDQIRPSAYLLFKPSQSLELELRGGSMFGEHVVYQFTGDIRLADTSYPWVMGKADLKLGESTSLQTQIYYHRLIGKMLYRQRIAGFGVWLADIPSLNVDAQTADAQVQIETQLSDQFLVVGGGNLRFSKLGESGNLILSEDQELRGAVFGQLQWTPWLAGQEPRIQITAGARLDLNTFSEAALSPRVAAIFQAWPGQYFRLSYGLAFRKPSIFESRIHLRVDNFNPSVPEIADLLLDQLGNEDLINEKVHTFEAGWRARFLGDRLRLSLDLFFSMYRDSIVLVDILAMRFGLPYIPDSILEYRNEGAEVNALGGELELYFYPSERWSIWCNLGLRRVSYSGNDELSPFEPKLRMNLGGRFLPRDGFFFDIALHYVSEYEMPGVDPISSLGVPSNDLLGNSFLLIGRAGYRMNHDEPSLEAGLTVQVPLGAPFRESPGASMTQSAWTDTSADFGGELLTRLVALYLRGSF